MQTPITLKKFDDKIKLVDDQNETLFIANDTPGDLEMFLRMRDCLNACDGMEDPLNDVNNLIIEANKPDKKVDWHKVYVAMSLPEAISHQYESTYDDIAYEKAIISRVFHLADLVMVEYDRRAAIKNIPKGECE